EGGDIALVPAFVAADGEHRIDDRAVVRETQPSVVARPRSARVAHVPLADMRRLVAQALQDDMVVGQAMAVGVARHIVDDAVSAGVLAGEDRGAVGRAERRGVEGRTEERAFPTDAGDMRRLHEGMRADGKVVEPEVVDPGDDGSWVALSRPDDVP